MLEIKVKHAAELTPVENAQIEQVRDLAYAGQSGGGLDWASSEWFILGYLEDAVVSLVGVLEREIKVGEKTIRVGGVGGVATQPAYQKRGYAGQLLKQTEQLLKDELNVPFGLLVCDPELLQYYGKFGWQAMQAPVFFDFQGEKRRMHEHTMILLIS